MWLRKSPERVRDLYRECSHISTQARKYKYGGGHTSLLKDIRPHDGLDCSSSTALALSRHGFFPHAHAWVSGDFARHWGAPGRGRYFTVWANNGHVWIQFHLIGRFWRFDTSPWGSGGRGPRMRITPRSTRGFTPRHIPGL